jgi:antirestriction protein
MTIKQKFSSIDQSKLTADQKSFLDKIKNVTKDFTDAEMNKKVEQPLDNFIAKAKEKMPEAIKSAPVKRTSTKANPSQTKKPKRTPMSLAKEIRKEGESWSDARARASKMMKEDSKDLSKTVETELDKLTKLVRSQKDKDKLAGISGTDIKRDSVRKAKPRGTRTVTHSGETSNQYGTFNNKLGRKYTENRDRHSDRLAPNYPKNAPLLAEGGDIDAFTLRMVKSNGMQPAEVLKEDANVKYADGGLFSTGRPKSALMRDRKNVNHSEDYEVRYSKPRPSRTGYSGNRRFAGGGRVESLTKELHRLQRELNSSRLQTYRLGDVSQEAIDRKKEREVKLARFNEVLKELRETDEKFALGGTVVTDLAGHTGGGTGGLNAGMPLNGFSNTSYTGLVGETGAMSSGEMFMTGGGVGDKEFSLADAIAFIKGAKKDRMTFYYNVYGGNDYFTLEPTFATPTGKLKGYPRKVTITKEGGITGKNLTYELGGGLPSGVSQSYIVTEAFGNPAQHFGIGGGLPSGAQQSYTNYYLTTGGAVTNERRYVNKAQDYEVRYSKPILRRKGYQGKRDFAIGGAIKNQYAGRTPEDIWNKLSVEQRKHFLLDHISGEEEIEQIKYRYAGEDNREFIDEYSNKEWKKLSGDVKQAFREHVKLGEYNKGGALTNERLHVNHNEDYEVRYAKPRPSRKGYKGARKFMAGGMNDETPRIYVADLEAYNNGRLVGEWLDLADYDDADELMDAIENVIQKSGGEEYAIHDVEYIPSSMYSEYMGKKDFEQLYEMMDLAKQNNLPLEVVQEVVSQFSESAVDDFVGKYDSAVDFAEELVDEMGIESFTDFEYYLDVSETDRRLLAQEMADSYADDIRDEDGGNRLIMEAGMNVDDYEEADSGMQEEMLDNAREVVYDEYYDTWYDGLKNPYYFLVEEQGLYNAEDFAKQNFVRVDYDKLADALEQDYTFVQHDGNVYVFNIR